MKQLKLLPLLFLLGLCFCLLTGCGKTEEGETPVVSGSADVSGSGTAAGSVAAPGTEESDFVYSASFREIAIEEDSYPSFLGYTADGVYLGVYELIEKGEIPEGVVPEYEGQFDTYGQRLYFLTLQGERKALDYVPAGGEEDSEGRKDYSAGSSVLVIFPVGEGQLIALEDVYASWWDGPEGMDETDPDYWDYSHYEDSYRLLRLDGEGKLLSAVPLDWNSAEHQDEWLNFSEAVLDEKERVCVCGQMAVYIFNADGALESTLELEDWPYGLLKLRDGQVGLVTSGMRGQALAVLDTDKGSITGTAKLGLWPDRCFSGSGDYDFYFISGTKLYGYSLAENSEYELVNLLDCDLSAGEIRWLQAQADGGFLCYCGDNEKLSQAELRLTPRSSVTEKQVLTLGTLGGSNIEEAVIRFNRRHSDVRIEVIDYSATFSEGESDMDGLIRLSTEIMTGGMPDLLVLSGLPYEQLAAKGLLEDLYPWIDADPELDRSDFMPNVLRAMEEGGKLCEICCGFEISTLIGASSVVGDEPGWSFAQVDQALARMPEGCSLLGPYCSRDQIFELCVYADLDGYIDWENLSCDFENGDFCQLLAFCARFPAEPDYYADYDSEFALVASGQQMLMQQYIFGLEELGYVDQYFGGRTTFIGFPVRSGSGSVLVLNDAVGMSARCGNKQAAWDFLREFLLPDYQREQHNLPVRQDVLQEQLEDAMRIDYLTNEDGQYLLDENGDRIPVVRGGMSVADDSGGLFSYEYYGLSEEQAQRFLHLLELTDRAPSAYSKVFSLIRNEAQVYFAGQRSAEETARIIQSKVTLYLSEQN